MTIYLILGIYIILSIWITVNFSGKTSESFLIADRNRSKWQILFSKFAQSVGMGFFISYSAYMYEYGVSTLAMIVGMILSYIFFAFWVVPKIYKESKKREFLTHGDYVESKVFSKLSKKIIDMSSVLITFIWLLTSFIGGAKVIYSLGIMSYGWALFLIGSVILIYLIISGFKAIIITDMIQGVLILLLLSVSIILFSNINNMEIKDIIKFSEIETMPIGLLFGLLIYGLFSTFSLADRFQLVYSAKSELAAKKGMLYSIIPIIFVSFIILIISLIIKTVNPNIDPDLAFVTFLFEYMSTWFIPFATVIIFAGLMSSVDTNIFNISSYLSSLFIGNKSDKEKQVKRQKSIIFLVVSFALIFSFLFRDMVGVVVFGASMTLTSSMAMIYVLAGGDSSIKFNLSIVFGYIGVIIGIIVLGITPSIAILPLIFGGLALLIPNNFIIKKNKK